MCQRYSVVGVHRDGRRQTLLVNVPEFDAAFTLKNMVELHNFARLELLREKNTLLTRTPLLDALAMAVRAG